MKELFDNNKKWAREIKQEDPSFFERLSSLQSPKYLWIGCSDSRVPANEIVGLLPGELFVHRNVANVVVHTDFNCLSVLQYAIDVLQVEHIIVCGHYGCGGVKAAMENKQLGLVDNWIRNIRDVYRYHRKALNSIDDEKQRQDKLCELNVLEQVANVCHTNVVQDAWKRGQNIHVHGWIFSISDGILKDLGASISGQEQLSPIYRI